MISTALFFITFISSSVTLRWFFTSPRLLTSSFIFPEHFATSLDNFWKLALVSSSAFFSTSALHRALVEDRLTLCISLFISTMLSTTSLRVSSMHLWELVNVSLSNSKSPWSCPVWALSLSGEACLRRFTELFMLAADIDISPMDMHNLFCSLLCFSSRVPSIGQWFRISSVVTDASSILFTAAHMVSERSRLSVASKSRLSLNRGWPFSYIKAPFLFTVGGVLSSESLLLSFGRSFSLWLRSSEFFTELSPVSSSMWFGSGLATCSTAGTFMLVMPPATGNGICINSVSILASGVFCVITI